MDKSNRDRMVRINMDGRIRKIPGLDDYCAKRGLAYPVHNLFPVEAIRNQQIPQYLKVLEKLIEDINIEEVNHKEYRHEQLMSSKYHPFLLGPVEDVIEYLFNVASKEKIKISEFREKHKKLYRLLIQKEKDVLLDYKKRADKKRICKTDSADEEKRIRAGCGAIMSPCDSLNSEGIPRALFLGEIFYQLNGSGV